MRIHNVDRGWVDEWVYVCMYVYFEPGWIRLIHTYEYLWIPGGLL